eukprot:Skav218464  [mRNA]  locus=scaffold538:794200:805905:+ [translate_table: standard]
MMAGASFPQASALSKLVHSEESRLQLLQQWKCDLEKAAATVSAEQDFRGLQAVDYSRPWLYLGGGSGQWPAPDCIEFDRRSVSVGAHRCSDVLSAHLLAAGAVLLRVVSDTESIAETLSQLVLEAPDDRCDAELYSNRGFPSLNHELLEILKKLFNTRYKEGDPLMPICPEHVTAKCRKDTCPLDHPEVGKTHEAKQLLNSKKGPKPIFDGVGLHAWLELVNVCKTQVRTGKCSRKDNGCKWLHPEGRVLEKMQEALRSKQKSEYVKFDFRSLQDLETVRLVTILASAMFQESHLADTEEIAGEKGLDV